MFPSTAWDAMAAAATAPPHENAVQAGRVGVGNAAMVSNFGFLRLLRLLVLSANPLPDMLWISTLGPQAPQINTAMDEGLGLALGHGASRQLIIVRYPHPPSATPMRFYTHLELFMAAWRKI